MRIALLLAGGVVGLGVLALVAAVVFLSTGAGREAVREIAQREVDRAIPGSIRIGRVRGLSLSGLELAEVAIDSPEGRPVLSAGRLAASVTLARLLPPRFALRATVGELDVVLRAAKDGPWEIERTFVDRTAELEPTGPAPESPIGAISVRLDGARVRIEDLLEGPIQASDVTAEGVVDLSDLDRVRIDVASLAARVGQRSTLAARGRIVTGDRGELALEVQRLHLEGVDLRELVPPIAPAAVISGSATVSGPLDAPSIVGRFEAPGGGMVEGTVDAPARPETPVVIRADLFDVAPELWLEGAPAGRLTGGGRVSVLPADSGWPALDGELLLLDPVVADVRLSRLQLTLQTRGRELGLEVEAAAPSSPQLLRGDATLGLDAPHALVAQTALDVLRPAEILPAAADLGGLEPLRWRGVVELRSPSLVPDGGNASPVLDLQLALSESQVAGWPVDAATARLRWAEPRLEVSRLTVDARGSRLEGSGEIQLAAGSAGATGGAASRLDAQLTGSLDLAGLEPGSRGTVRVEAQVGGPLDALAARLRATSPVVTAGGATLRDVDLVADASGIGSTEPRAASTFLGRLDRGAEAASLALSGAVSLGARRAGRGWEVATTIERLAVESRRGPEPPIVWRSTAPARLDLRDDRVETQPLRLVSGASSVSLSGRLARRPGSATDLRLEIDALDGRRVCPLLSPASSCAGTLSGSLSLGGDFSRVRVGADVHGRALSWRGVEIGDLALRASSDTSLRVQAAVAASHGARIDVTGSLPLATRDGLPEIPPGGPIDLAAETRELEVGALARTVNVEAVRDLSGRMTATARVRGTLARPDLAGEVVVENLGLQVVATGSRIRASRVELGFEETRLEVRRLRADDGTLDVTGEVGFDDGEIRPRLAIELRDFLAVDRPDATATARGTIRVEGTASAPVVYGNVLVPRARIEPGVVPGGGVARLDPTIVVVRGRPQDAPPLVGPPAPAAVDLVESLTMDVRLALGDAVVVQRLDASVRLRGGVALWKVPGQPFGVVGEIRSNEGWYVFQGRRLELVHASVRFDGDPELDPTLNILAQYRSPRYLVLVRVQGTARHPELDLSSQPSLSESDVLAVLLFGRPTDELSGGQGGALQQQALSLLASYVAPGLERSVANTLGLATITWQLEGGDQYGSLGVGRYFGDDLFVSIGQQFGGPQGGTQRQLRGLAGSSITVQYYLTPSLTVQSSASTEGETAIDVFWQTQYGRPGGDASRPPEPPVGVVPTPWSSPLPTPAGTSAR